jgi:hypothetical protein
MKHIGLIGPLKKAEPFLFQNILFWMHIVANVSWLFWNLYRKRILLISIMTIFNEKKSWLFTVGLGLKFEVVFRIGLFTYWPIFIIFRNWTLKCNKNCSLTQRNAKQLNISNLTKENEIHETEPQNNYEMKRNFTFDETKRNFAVYFVSRNKQNFAKQFFVSLCFVFRETMKMMRNGNPTFGLLNPNPLEFLRYLYLFLSY